MELFPPIRKYTLKQLFLTLSVITCISLSCILHFILEIRSLNRISLPLVFTNFHYIGAIIGFFILIRFLRNVSAYLLYYLSSTLLIIFMMCLVVIEIPWLLCIFLFLAGFFMAITIGLSREIIYQFHKDKATNGRLHAFGFNIIFINTILYFLIDFNIETKYLLVFLTFLLIIILIAGVIGENSISLPEYNKLPLNYYVTTKNNIPKILLAIFIGFFFVNGYYSTLIILEINNLQNIFYRFLIPFFISSIITNFFTGILLDKLGRRFILLIGLCIQSFAFLILSIDDITLSIYFIFPVILGIGYAFAINAGFTIYSEMSEKKYFQDKNCIFFMFHYIGCMLGSIMAEVLRPLLDENPTLMTMFLLFISLISTLVVFNIEETLPSREELEWKNSLKYIYVLYKSGFCCYSQNLVDIERDNSRLSENLIGGVLVAISSILKEISDNKPLKVVKQEGFNILIEEGKHIIVAVISINELKIIHRKMNSFINEFENFFEVFIKEHNQDLRVYTPTMKLVEKNFS